MRPRVLCAGQRDPLPAPGVVAVDRCTGRAEAPDSSRPIAIDPHVAFGRPVVQRAGISTVAIANRIDAGETVADLAADYSLSAEEIEQACATSGRLEADLLR
jgi:uncharacterized protein (DUF433 family)